MKWLAALALYLLPALALAAGSPLPSGYLSVTGNQIVDSAGNNVRISGVSYDDNINPVTDMPIIRNVGGTGVGWNAVRYSYFDLTTCPGGVCNFTNMDAVVNAATAAGLKVIFNHHGNEQNPTCEGQQTNGLWIDSGPGTNNTDGCPTPITGTVTYARFKANWVSIATHYASNPTVIGFDLHNEPLTYGNPYCCSLTGVTWASGTATDILAMANDVGAAIHAVNPGALIILEGPISQFNLLNGQPIGLDPNAVIQDLSMAGTNPVTAIPGKVVYSIHEYTCTLSGQCPDTGPTKIAAMNAAWGYLEANGLAPVWIGEIGANLDNSDGNQATDQAWANTVIPYMNGTAPGGPTFTASQQPISTAWFAYGFNPGNEPDGTCSVADCSAMRDGTYASPTSPSQMLYWKQLLYTPITPVVGGSTWSPTDKSVSIALSNSNLNATASGSIGQSVRSSTSKSAGKFCLQFTVPAVATSTAIGFSIAAEPLNGFLGGAGSKGIGFLMSTAQSGSINVNGVTYFSGFGSVAGDTITMAVDIDNLKLWVQSPEMVAHSTPWNHSAIGSQNPVGGIGGVSFSSAVGLSPVFAEFNTQAASQVNANFSPTTGCPTGFTAWGTGGPTTVTGPIYTILGANPWPLLPVSYGVPHGHLSIRQ